MQPARTRKKIIAPASWEDIPCGEYYRAALEQHLQACWGKLYGFHLLKLGNLSAELDTSTCPISHQVNVAEAGANLHVQGDHYHLPFAHKSVDACLIAHTLAYAEDPHRILREVDRVLIDDGWLVLSCFNPLSLLGMGKMMPFFRKRQPYASRMFTLMRLLDWLGLLNYEVIVKTCFQVLPWSPKGGEMLNTHLPALGCMTMIVARKRTLPLTPTAKKVPARRQAIQQAVGASSKSYRKDHKK
ncbi:MAG: class I SAM-dependent methyltransferase [Ewingella sp.]